MKTITVRDLRQRWPQAEAMLEAHEELVVTRDGTPVARLLPIKNREKRRRRFDPRTHAAWQARVNRGQTVRWVDEFLTAERGADARAWSISTVARSSSSCGPSLKARRSANASPARAS